MGYQMIFLLKKVNVRIFLVRVYFLTTVFVGFLESWFPPNVGIYFLIFILLYNLSNKVFVIVSPLILLGYLHFPMLLNVFQFSRMSVINICANPIILNENYFIKVQYFALKR